MAVAPLLSEALSRTILEPIPGSRTVSPATLRAPVPRGLASPFRPISPATSSARSSPSPSIAPSFYSAHSDANGIHKRRPSPISIPIGTDDQPLFSAYPLQPTASGQQTARALHPTAASTASTTAAVVGEAPAASEPSSGWPQQSSSSWEQHQPYESNTASSSTERKSPPRTQSTVSLSRHRSTSAIGLFKKAQDRSAKFGTPKSPDQSDIRRRASFNANESDIERWREMGEAAQHQNSVPYGYGTDDGYTLQSVKMVSGVRPLSPALVPPRKSSLANCDDGTLLGFSALQISNNKEVQELPTIDFQHKHDDTTVVVAADHASFVSETMSSSPSAMTKSLPSTKTSLSRSARSGKEGEDDKAIQLGQVNAKLATNKSQALLEKRRMILLEIAETEVTYVHDLRTLVHVYLPQLAALPHVSDRIHSLIVRNTKDLLEFHVQFAAHMVDILRYCDLGYEQTDADTIDKAIKRFAELFVREVSSFSLYNDYCAGSTAASALVRGIAHRTDYEAFEKRCQFIASTAPHATLRDILHHRAGQPCRTRLRFKDILITPVQRVCRYPLLLASLLADVNGDLPPTEVFMAVEAAQASMRAVAENADDARQRKEAELKTINVLERLEPHPVVTYDFARHMGVCRLIGALDVLYHHPVHAPLEPPVKVKYLAAFLYRGYLILAKIRRGKTFEPKHYLPLEAFELIDITDGFLPHSIRLTLREHHFDLAATCGAEKELWATELCAARDESMIPPFELPSSVSLFAPRDRNSSATISEEATPEVSVSPPRKRHTMVDMGSPDRLYPPFDAGSISTPDYRVSQPSTLLLRRVSASQRMQVDRALADVISEPLATARSKVQMQYTNAGYDSRRTSILDTPKLRRRLSFADSRTMLDVRPSSDIRGSVLPSRPVTRVRPTTTIITDGGFALELDVTDISRNTSFSSLSEVPLRGRRSSMSLRRTIGGGLDMTMTPTATPARQERAHRRQTASISSLGAERRSLARARSMPASPISPPRLLPEPLPTEALNLAEILDAIRHPGGQKRASTAPSEGGSAGHRRTPSETSGAHRRNPSEPTTGTHRREWSTSTVDSFVLVPVPEVVANSPPPKVVAPRPTPVPSRPSVLTSGSIKRSLSLFGRRGPSLSSLSTQGIEQSGEAIEYCDSPLTDSPQSPISLLSRLPSRSGSRNVSRTPSRSSSSNNLTVPTSPELSPTTPKRRRSIRLFGQLRGFTPI